MEERILDYFGEFDERSRIVAAKYFFMESEAYLYAARLREAGIPHFISNGNVMTALPLGGGGGIGLHVRDTDLPEASRIIARLDYQKRKAPEEGTFHDADEEEIAYLRAVYGEKSNSQSGKFIVWLIAGIVLLLILRAFLRAAGIVESWWDYF